MLEAAIHKVIPCFSAILKELHQAVLSPRNFLPEMHLLPPPHPQAILRLPDNGRIDWSERPSIEEEPRHQHTHPAGQNNTDQGAELAC